MQPCNTCVYSCREGYCGIGKRPYDNYCGDHEVGDRAPVPEHGALRWARQGPNLDHYYYRRDWSPPESPWVTRLRQLPLTDQLPGLPYIVRGEEGNLDVLCGHLRVRYVLVLPRTYQALWMYQRSIDRTDLPLRFGYQHHEIHVWQTPGLPVIVAVAYEQTVYDPQYVPEWLLRWDIGEYLWWAGWAVDTWRVEAFLQGLVALRTAHLRHEVVMDRAPQGIFTPVMGMYPTRVVPPEEVYNRLLDQYMREATTFMVADQGAVAGYLERWGHMLSHHSYPEDRHGRRR